LTTELRSLTYYLLFLIFPFETETDEEDIAKDATLNHEASQAPSFDTGTSTGHEKMMDVTVSPVRDDAKSQVSHYSVV
jgi:NCS1 family nucleobase:cation symporter-1